jgi:hypothetical protein
MDAERLAMQIWRARQRDLISRPRLKSPRETVHPVFVIDPPRMRGPERGAGSRKRAPILPPC